MSRDRIAGGALSPAPERPASAWRREEIAIGITLVLALAFCLASGTGFEFRDVFWGYFRFFGMYGLYLFATVRIAQLVRFRWRPAGRLGRFALDRLGGPCSYEEAFRTDIEFLRGFLILLVTITVYTNLKVRIPILNPLVGDNFFQTLDYILLGDRLVPWLEHFTALHPFWARVGDRIYHHGFLWMILLIGWFWIRTDRRSLRWLFGSFCLIYMVAIFITLAYPSYGPFLFDWERFKWSAGSMSNLTQARLVDFYLAATKAADQGKPIFIAAFHGIAAFPSLHVAFMVMLAVIGWRTARPFAIFMIGVAVATTIATLMFGWHYFVDAPAGALIAVLVPLGIRKWVFGAGTDPG